ncbi:hypothetical protein GY45DRAFT_1148523 [Cubamyces sp. BRFM 1775]|nr:hypothetical protein GY45DRAFT_1148523 [Cubamyces sp. BRFM 1775]
MGVSHVPNRMDRPCRNSRQKTKNEQRPLSAPESGNDERICRAKPCNISSHAAGRERAKSLRARRRDSPRSDKADDHPTWPCKMHLRQRASERVELTFRFAFSPSLPLWQHRVISAHSSVSEPPASCGAPPFAHPLPQFQPSSTSPDGSSATEGLRGWALRGCRPGNWVPTASRHPSASAQAQLVQTAVGPACACRIWIDWAIFGGRGEAQLDLVHNMNRLTLPCERDGPRGQAIVARAVSKRSHPPRIGQARVIPMLSARLSLEP